MAYRVVVESRVSEAFSRCEQGRRKPLNADRYAASCIVHVFIDTNILLSFYHFTNEDLDVLSSVFVSSESGEANLYLTDQVRDEFNRNRETKLRDALRQFRNFNPADQLPFFMKAYKEYGALRRLTRRFKEYAKSIQEQADADIRARNLRADKMIDGFFEKYQVLATTEVVYADAVRRVDIGNPPGKRGSIGDAINWLLLLESVPDDQDLFLIADDEDFRSPLFPDQPNDFLVREWRERKNAQLRYYKSLNRFFDEHYDGLHVSYDSEKQELIESLAHCRSFAATHAVVAKLRPYQHFSFQEARSILETTNQNDQIWGIRGDVDVEQLLRTSLLPHQDKLAVFDHRGFLAELIPSIEGELEE